MKIYSLMSAMILRSLKSLTSKASGQCFTKSQNAWPVSYRFPDLGVPEALCSGSATSESNIIIKITQEVKQNVF